MGDFWQFRPGQRALAANANTSSFPSKVYTVTEPTNDGVLNLVGSGVQVPKWLKIWPIGLGANNDGFSLRVLGWNYIGGNTETQGARAWWPSIIAEYACLLGNFAGLAGSPVLNTEFFCDTMTPVAARQADCVIAAGTAVQTLYEVISPVNDTPAWARIPILGWQKIEFTFDQTTNTPTMNVIYELLS